MLKEVDFADVLAKDIDSAVETFVEVVLSKANQFISTRALRKVKGTHPWLTDKCRAAIVFEHSREGTSDYKDASELCTQELRLAYAGYMDSTRAGIRALPTGSKKWWSLSKVLMDNAPTKSGIPSLRDPAGKWVHDGHVKVELFAKALSSKFVLPDAVEEHPVANDEPPFKMSEFVLIRQR